MRRTIILGALALAACSPPGARERKPVEDPVRATAVKTGEPSTLERQKAGMVRRFDLRAVQINDRRRRRYEQAVRTCEAIEAAKATNIAHCPPPRPRYLPNPFG